MCAKYLKRQERVSKSAVDSAAPLRELLTRFRAGRGQHQSRKSDV